MSWKQYSDRFYSSGIFFYAVIIGKSLVLSKNPINLHEKCIVVRLSSQEIEGSMHAGICKNW